MATVGQVIHDFANALTTESDEAWLRKRGRTACDGLDGWARFTSDALSIHFQVEGRRERKAFAALRRAVEAIEAIEGGGK